MRLYGHRFRLYFRSECESHDLKKSAPDRELSKLLSVASMQPGPNIWSSITQSGDIFSPTPCSFVADQIFGST